MGRSDTTEIIIENAPAALNLLGHLISWISSLEGTAEDDSLKESGGNDISDQSFQTLSEDSQSKSRNHFLQQFGYPYLGNASVPPQRVGPQISASEDYFNAQANNTGVVTTAVLASMGATAPPWVEPQMSSDLAQRVTTLLEAPATNAFIQKAFTINYTKPDGTVNYQADICWVYCVTQAPDPVQAGQNVNTLFLYSIGVAYEAIVWAQRLESVGSTTWPVVRIAFAFSTAAVGAALAAFVYEAKNKPTTIYTTWNTFGYQGEFTITTQNPPPSKPGLGDPEIPYQWALDALTTAGVTNMTVGQGTATANEAAEFEYLAEWGAASGHP